MIQRFIKLKKKIYNQKRNHTNTNISNGELIAIKSSSIIMNICFSYVEEYACVVTCVPYYMNCNVSENVNFKNIYISSEICSKHTDSMYYGVICWGHGGVSGGRGVSDMQKGCFDSWPGSWSLLFAGRALQMRIF